MVRFWAVPLTMDARGAAACSATAHHPLTRRRAACSLIFVAHQLPLRAVDDGNGGHSFEWDEDSLIFQAKVGTQGRNNEQAPHAPPLPSRPRRQAPRHMSAAT